MKKITQNQQQIRQLGASLIAGETLASAVREAFLSAILKDADIQSPIYETLDKLKAIARDVLPQVATTFWESDVAAWLAAYRHGARLLPKWSVTYLQETGFGQNSIFSEPINGDLPPPIIFPKLEKAAKSLMQRGVVQRPVFDTLNDRAKARAFTVAGEIFDGTIARIRDVLAEATATGPSLPAFRRVLQHKLRTSLLGPAHVETVYRTNLQAAYRDGMQSLVNDPVVGSIFPYQSYLPISDGRARPEHLALGGLGLNGTGIYRRDDPFWDLFTPPWGFNCRCGTNLLTIRSAARQGVLEAQRWLKTGSPPEVPEYRIDKIPFESQPGFGQRSGELVT